MDIPPHLELFLFVSLLIPLNERSITFHSSFIPLKPWFIPAHPVFPTKTPQSRSVRGLIGLVFATLLLKKRLPGQSLFFLFIQNRIDVFYGHWFVEIEALTAFASDGTKDGELLDGFNALCDGLHA